MEPVLFLPGFMSDSRLFAPQIEALSRHRAVQIAPLSGLDSVRDMAIRVLEAAPARFALAGASLGGMVAMEVMRRAPERVTRLALISTDALAESPGVAAAREGMMTRARAGRLSDAMDEAIPSGSLAPGPRRTAICDLVREMGVSAGAEAFLAQSRALQRRPDQQGTLRRISVPTVVICGDHDHLMTPRRHQLMSDLTPRAHLVVLENAGHLPTLETPGEMVEILDAWLSL